MTFRRQTVAAALTTSTHVSGTVVTAGLNISSTPHFITLLQFTSFLLIANKSYFTDGSDRTQRNSFEAGEIHHAV
jgi:hypothetical protein